ncbi:MAG: PAS domain-containing sensor histidine kinase [Hasllibacter sp.]
MTLAPDIHVQPFENRTDRAFVDSEVPDGSFLLSILQSSPDCVKVIEVDGTLSFMNHNGMCAMEIDDFGAVKGAEWCTLWPEESRGMIARAVEMALRGQSVRLEAPCPTAKGTPRWWEVTVSPVVGPDGTVQRVLSVSRDVTERVESRARLEEQDERLRRLAAEQERRIDEQDLALERSEVTLREVDHRVKNSLAMVSAILRTQSRKFPAAQAHLLDAADRVRLVAEVHGAIYAAASSSRIEMDEFLADLAETLSRSLAGADVRIEHDICKRSLDGDQALALGLIASELITNALRHAFPEGQGLIRLGCETNGERTAMTVRDDGAGFPETFDLHLSEGLGSKVVMTYADRLGAEVETGPSPEGGAQVRVVF